MRIVTGGPGRALSKNGPGQSVGMQIGEEGVNSFASSLRPALGCSTGFTRGLEHSDGAGSRAAKVDTGVAVLGWSEQNESGWPGNFID